MGAGKRPLSRRGFILGAGAAVTAAEVAWPGRAGAAADAGTAFQSDGGINGGYLVNQLAGNGQSVARLAFITSAAGGNLRGAESRVSRNGGAG